MHGGRAPIGPAGNLSASPDSYPQQKEGRKGEGREKNGGNKWQNKMRREKNKRKAKGKYKRGSASVMGIDAPGVLNTGESRERLN